ncbi:MAG: ATP-binding protein [Spirochaetales bacterium]|nr:ATP-binding protein [Spirochaetales bacterium]
MKIFRLPDLPDCVEEDVILSWRERIFTIIFSCVCLMAVFPYVMSILRAFRDQIWVNFIIYTFSYSLCFIILFARKIPFIIRNIMGLLVFYLLGITALVIVGPLGSGKIWLFSLSIHACLLLGVYAGVATLLINSLILIVIGFLVSRGIIVWFTGSHLGAWVVTTVTFIFLNGIATISLGIMVRALENKLREERRAARELKNSRAKMVQILDSSPIAAYVLDDKGVIKHWNRFCEVISGLTSEDVVGTKKQWSLLYEHEKSMLADYILAGITPEKTDEEIYPSRLSEGALEGTIFSTGSNSPARWYFRTAVPLRDADGVLNGSMETIMDITDLKSAEERLIKAQRMESVGRLAGGVAHDYNNISSIIIGYADLILNDMDKDDPLYEGMTEILNAAERSSNITGQLLAFARQQPAKPESIIVNNLIEDILKMLRRLIGEDVSLEWLPGDDIWPILIDPTQVDQILANLCVNARDAISDVGRILIETKNMSFEGEVLKDSGEEVSGDYVMLAVSDNGRGMEAAVLENIFEPFFTTKEIGEGTGLGLATVYGIVKQNDGFVNVYSEPGRGTTFRIYLKRSDSSVVLKKGKKGSLPPKGQEETVYIVEDDKAILKLSEKILTGHGYRALTFTSPFEALAACKEEGRPIDILLTDVVMPEMNGKDLSREVLKIFPHTKVVFMSGYTSSVINERGILDRDVSFIGKPFSGRELIQKIWETLSV